MLKIPRIAHVPAKSGPQTWTILQMLRENHCEDAAIC